MSRRKLSKADYKSLNRGCALVVYPPDGGRAQVRTPTTRQKRSMTIAGPSNNLRLRLESVGQPTPLTLTPTFYVEAAS